VQVLDIDQAALARGMETVARNYGVSVSRGRLTQAEMDARLARITAVTSYEAIGQADVVVEAVFEDLALKQRIFETLDAVDPFGDLERHTSGRLADVAFDAAAVPAVAALLPRLVRPAGRIGLVGTYARPVELDLQAILFKELTVLGNRVYQPADIDAALRMLADGPAAFRPLISEVVGLDEASAAFARLRAGEGVKYLVATGGR
jgi:threonine dehydrogenase-like Zn-dependent dehydrogenase